MHAEICVAKKILGINGTIKQQEAEKEDRHYDHMEKLGYKTSESCWKIAHFLSHFRCDKITKYIYLSQIIDFGHKNTPIITFPPHISHLFHIKADLA